MIGNKPCGNLVSRLHIDFERVSCRGANLHWRDVLGAVGRGLFYPRTEALGWPEFMSLNQVVALQRPQSLAGSTDEDHGPAYWALRDALVAAAECGALECHAVPTFTADFDAKVRRQLHETQVAERVFELLGDGDSHSDAEVNRAYEQARREISERRHSHLHIAIGAAGFARWLAEQSEPPSPHMLAWFEVYGVAWPVVPAPPVSGQPVAATDWQSLVAQRGSTKGKGWTGEQRDAAAAELARRQSAGIGKSAAAVAMAHELGITRQTLTANLTRERKRQSHQARAAGVFPVDQLRAGRGG